MKYIIFQPFFVREHIDGTSKVPKIRQLMSKSGNKSVFIIFFWQNGTSDRRNWRGPVTYYSYFFFEGCILVYRNLFSRFLPPTDVCWVEETISAIAEMDCQLPRPEMYVSNILVGIDSDSILQESRRPWSVTGSWKVEFITRWNCNSADSNERVCSCSRLEKSRTSIIA